MSGWRWLDERVVIAIHDAQLSEHGGASAIRGVGLLRSALARPQHMAAYEAPDAFDLAAAYAWGIVRNHPFVDGNKRTALVAAGVFLYDYGHDIDAGDAETVRVMLALTAGELAERDFAAWLRANSITVESEK